jgi:hypothetical protein
LLTIVIVNFNTSDFIKTTLYSLAKLTKNEFKVIVCDNGSNWYDKIKLKRFVKKYGNVSIIWRQQSEYGSRGHGEALNLLIEKINTPYGIILDSDAIILKKNWDQILINQLKEGAKIIGAPPVKNPLKPDDFPSVYLTFFETETFKSLKIDMNPFDISSGKDTGWEVRENFLDKKIKFKIFDVKNTRNYKRGPFKDIICTEYYLDGYSDIIGSHFGRGASKGIKYQNSRNIPLLTNMLNKFRGNYSKTKWIKICYTIINNQSNTRGEKIGQKNNI